MMSNQALSELYERLGYPSKSKFTSAATKLINEGSLDATKGQVKAFLEQSDISIHDKPNIEHKKFSYPRYDFALIMDLMDMNKEKAQNSQYNWILNILEHHSRFVWSFPLKSKSSLVESMTAAEKNPIAAAIQAVIEQIDPDQIADILLVSDGGTEFKGRVTTMLKQYPSVYRRISTPDYKSTMPVERFNYTLRQALARSFAHHKNLKWLSVLPNIISAYNSSESNADLDDYSNSKIPVDRLLSIVKDVADGNRHAVIDLRYREPVYDVGTKVRIANRINLFDKKSMKPKLSSKVYTIVKYQLPYVIVADSQGNEQSVAYKRLKPTNAQVTDHESVIDQIEAEETHQRHQRRLAKEILSPKSIDNEVVIDEDGRERVQIKKRRLPLREKRDKTAANARIAAQFKGKARD